VKSLDPSRLVDNSSGWTDCGSGDVHDIHSYPGPATPPIEKTRAVVLGEFGGLGLGVDGHTWSAKSWGYQGMASQQELTDRYERLLGRAWEMFENEGLCAGIYTQTTDVETECNGLLTYDRAVAKLDPAVARAIIRGASEKQLRVIVSNALYGRVNWKYTTEKPPDDWINPSFDDSKWAEGIGGFGTAGTPGTVVNTTWDTKDIWLRRQFTLNTNDLANAKIQLHHDEDAEVYFNGITALQANGYTTSYEEIEPDPQAVAALHNGTNVMAVHCHQTTGGQYIDVGIVSLRPQAKPEAGK